MVSLAFGLSVPDVRKIHSASERMEWTEWIVDLIEKKDSEKSELGKIQKVYDGRKEDQE